ncbi:MAG: branched-chain amino acid ABC transporter substrate-binding protein [Deltaproteobacteria bacterium]|nr:branched-chain amino acid ABC transporter substrate-binding protein [Deltaproteobacteria bacterium]
MVNFKKYKKLVLLSDYSIYSDDRAHATEKHVKKLGGNVVLREKIKSGAQNFTPVLTTIKGLNPDVIYFTGYYSDGGVLRAQQAALDIKADFIGGESVDNPDFIKLAGAAGEGSYIINVPTPEMLTNDAAKDFKKDYQAKFNENVPNIITLYQADALNLIFHAMTKTGSTDAKKVTDFLHKIKDFPGTTGSINLDEKGNRFGTSDLTFLMHKDGTRDVVYPK